MTQLKWSRSHGDSDPVETLVIPRSGDPPAVAAAAAGPGASGEDATGGGAGGQSLPLDPVWVRMIEAGDPMDLADHMTAMAENPSLRAAALLRALERSRDLLEGIDSNAPLDLPVTIPVADLVSLTQLALARLR